MGMYTQVRGWLNVRSMGWGQLDALEERFERVKEQYLSEHNTDRQDIVVENTHFKIGFNGSAFIFIGTELKNYEEDAEVWLKFLINEFATSEGVICFQSELEEPQDDGTKFNTVWIVSGGEISEEFQAMPFNGYGNGI